MGFIPYRTDVADIPPFEYLPCDDIEIAVGSALLITGGQLVLATGTNKPTFISLSSQTIATAGDIIPVIRITPTMVFETTLLNDASGMGIGTMHTIHTDGAQITATTTNGIAEVVSYDANTATSKIRVRF